MRIGLAAIGIGTGATPAVLGEIARAADGAGFATLWMGEHVVLFDRHDSRYPYSESGEFPIAGDVEWLDPLVTLGYAAGVTRTIRLATGICLVPEHNPLILAKQAATLDRVSGGRFALGVGVGWMAEEFAALGVPFARRAERTREYIEVMRRLWREDVVTFDGEFVRFTGVRSAPKPVRRGVPVIIGGESRAALTRAADYGDGWYGFNLGPDEAARKIAELRQLLGARGRDLESFEIAVAPFTKRIVPADLAAYGALGVREVVLVETPPADADNVGAWVEQLAAKWVPAANAVG